MMEIMPQKAWIVASLQIGLRGAIRLLVLADGVQAVCAFHLPSRQYARFNWSVCVVYEKAVGEQASGGSSPNWTRSPLMEISLYGSYKKSLVWKTGIRLVGEL